MTRDLYGQMFDSWHGGNIMVFIRYCNRYLGSGPEEHAFFVHFNNRSELVIVNQVFRKLAISVI